MEMPKNRGNDVLWMETRQETQKLLKNFFKEKLMEWENVNDLIDIKQIMNYMIKLNYTKVMYTKLNQPENK